MTIVFEVVAARAAGAEPRPALRVAFVPQGSVISDTSAARAYAAEGLTGKLHETLLAPGEPDELWVGIGPPVELTADVLRRALGKVGTRLARRVAVEVLLPAVPETAAALVGAAVDGVMLGSYAFDRYRTRDVEPARLERMRLVLPEGHSADGLDEVARRAMMAASAERWARDLVNAPALDMTPEQLAVEAEGLASSLGLTATVWREAQLERERCGGVLGIGQGSVHPPRLIQLAYAAGEGPAVALVGKGITFDAGGTSVKKDTDQEWMKADMAGAAAVLAAVKAAAELRLPVNVVGVVAAAENLSGPTAIRPGDVLRLRSGLTCEVINTDYEGRVVLADALDLARELGAAAAISMGTLTGGGMVGLGLDITPVMGSDADVVFGVLEAGRAVGQPCWEYPLWTRYRREIESRVADLKNVPGPWAASITTALFLREFVGDVPWAHLDIAGTAWAPEDGELWTTGATGIPTRTLIRFLADRAGKAT
jgi:leucyl aminopeptidase